MKRLSASLILFASIVGCSPASDVTTNGSEDRNNSSEADVAEYNPPLPKIDTLTDIRPAESWFTRNATIQNREDAGLDVTINSAGLISMALTGVPTMNSDIYTLQANISSDIQQAVQVRIQSYCGGDLEDGTIRMIELQAGQNDVALEHAFETASDCSIIRFDNRSDNQINFSLDKLEVIRSSING